MIKHFIPAVLIVTCCLSTAFSAQISLVADDTNAPVQHGLAKLKLALKQKNVEIQQTATIRDATAKTIIVAGQTSKPGEAANLIKSLNLTPYSDPESLLIKKFQRDGADILLVTGSDPRGLMYALLDVTDRVAWAKSGDNVIRETRETVEKPYAPERAMSMYTMHRAYFEQRLYNEDYWAKYFDTLAQNRFDSFVMIFGYENGGFLAPAYPYFFDMPEFPDVRMVGITKEQQARNLAALKRMIQMAHDRGVKFTVGLWDHIYRGGVQAGGTAGAGDVQVRGVTTTNLSAYNQAALKKFVQLVPELDGIQFRMHDESGLRNNEQFAFWRDIFGIMKTNAPQMRFDARAKGLPDSIIQMGVNMGVNLRVTTKYWMEQMGLPYHPTHVNTPDQMNRRHGYADLLKYPQTYKMHWRLWNGGPSRVLLWGDPDYVRRFAESTHLYDGDGFEINEPLTTKMEAQPHTEKPFDLMPASHRYYEYEFERYWHLFQVFGRLGYNTNTPEDVFSHEFETRFGPDAAPFIEKGLHRASQVLPRIVTAVYPYGSFPMTRGWAEKQRLGDLPAYCRNEGSDIQQFASFDEEAQLLINGGETAKIRPQQTSRWFMQAAADINAHIAEAEKRIGTNANKEYQSTITDLRILANLALFHARRIPAAVSYRLFERTQDVKRLDDAINYERDAIAAWRQIVAAAGDFYTDDLKMGVRSANLCGHWKDELAALERGLATLEQQRKDFKAPADAKTAPAYKPATDSKPPMLVHQAITSAPANKPLTITTQVSSSTKVKWVRLRYRSVNQYKNYNTLEMTASGDTYRATIPGDQIPSTYDFMYFFEVMDENGNGKIYPDLEKETPYVVVKLQR